MNTHSAITARSAAARHSEFTGSRAIIAAFVLGYAVPRIRARLGVR